MNRVICYTLTISSFILLFSNCEEENTPGDPANPANPPNYFIQDCDTMLVDIVFTGTYFFNSDNGSYFDIDGAQEWNTDLSTSTPTPMCHQYVDQQLMIINGLTYLDLWTSTFMPTMYGSSAKLEYLSTNPGNPTLEIHLTNNDSRMVGIGIDDKFHLDLDIEEINLVPLNQPITYTSESYSIKQMVYGAFFKGEWTIEFTNIDMVNKVFEGNMVIDFSPRYMYDWNGNPDYDTYDVGTNTSFQAIVSSFKFTSE